MTKEQICMLVSMGVYLAAVLIIGIVYARRNKNTDDFYLGGRKLNPLVAAMSAEASDMSSWLLMGLPGVAYLTGLADATWTAIGLAVGTYINWLVVAKRLRRYTVVARNSITLPDFFSNRFHDEHKLLMSASALIILIFFVPYTASGFAACGKLFASLLPVDYETAMIISALVVVFYTAVGGFLAESMTDLIQGILMFAALIIIVVYATVAAGGISGMLNYTNSLPGFLDMFRSYVPKTGAAGSYGFITIISTCAWGLGYFGMPHILLRFMAINSEKQLKNSRRIAMTWVIISLIAAIFIGIVGAVAIPELVNRSSLIGAPQSALDAAGATAETIFIALAKHLGGHGILTLLIAGVILAGILAATMSTSDSQLLVSSSSISQNFIKGLLYKKASDKLLMWISRITVILISIVSIFIAWNKNNTIFGIVSFAWAGFGAAFGPVILFSLFWKRTTLWGAFTGMLTGGVMIFVWKFLIRPIGGIWNIYELLPAFIIACVVIAAVSLLGKEPSKEIQDEFDLAASSKPVD